MKTITINNTTDGDNLSAYIFEDGDTITSESDRVTCPDLVILDLDSSTSTIHTGVTPPEDWVGWKYFFDGTTWTVNELWEEPDF